MALHILSLHYNTQYHNAWLHCTKEAYKRQGFTVYVHVDRRYLSND
jgi:hypothetical protein